MQHLSRGVLRYGSVTDKGKGFFGIDGTQYRVSPAFLEQNASLWSWHRSSPCIALSWWYLTVIKARKDAENGSVRHLCFYTTWTWRCPSWSGRQQTAFVLDITDSVVCIYIQWRHQVWAQEPHFNHMTWHVSVLRHVSRTSPMCFPKDSHLSCYATQVDQATDSSAPVQVYTIIHGPILQVCVGVLCYL